MNKNPCPVVSCVFGGEFRKLHPSTRGRDNFLFTNNPEIKEEAVKKGWIYKFCRHHPISSSSYLSSLQSKYVKFLAFISEFPEFTDTNNIIYVDHKFKLDGDKIDSMERFYERRDHVLCIPPGSEVNIQAEIEAAKKYDRYSLTMPQTEKWARAVDRSKVASLDAGVKCTTFIYYKNVRKCLPLAREVHDMIWDIGQPECQVIFSLICQKYDFISPLTWAEIGGRRFDPV